MGKYSISSPLMWRPGRRGAPVLAQKRFNFSTLRGTQGAPEAGAFQRCGGGGKPQRLPQFLSLGDSQHKGTVEDVAGSQRIDGVHGEGRRLLQFTLPVEPEGTAWAPCGSEERRCELRD